MKGVRVSVMKKVMQELHSKLKKMHLGPARTRVHIDGKTTFTWYVDNEDDRFVEATNSTKSDDIMVVLRDKTTAAIAILGNTNDAVSWIETKLRELAK